MYSYEPTSSTVCVTACSTSAHNAYETNNRLSVVREQDLIHRDTDEVIIEIIHSRDNSGKFVHWECTVS